MSGGDSSGSFSPLRERAAHSGESELVPHEAQGRNVNIINCTNMLSRGVRGSKVVHR